MLTRRIRIGMVFAVSVSVACAPADDKAPVARGKGLELAKLPTGSEAVIYEAALREAFDIAPGLSLYLHPRRLPRSAGYTGGDSVPVRLTNALRQRGLIQGKCDPQRDSTTGVPRCNAAEAGYIVRASDVLQVAKDTLEVYFAAERFGTPTGPKQAPFHFEKIYQLIRDGSGWRVVREARVSDEKREEN